MDLSYQEIGLTSEGNCHLFSIPHLWDISGVCLFAYKLETLKENDYYGALCATLRSGRFEKGDNDFHRCCAREIKSIGPIIRKRACKLYDAGDVSSGSPTYVEAVHSVLMNFVSLFEKMKRGEAVEPIIVDIEEYGRTRIWEGHHRVAIAHAAGLAEIKGVIRRLDPRWAAFMRGLKEESESGYGRARALYNPVPHPLFRDWEVLREDRLPVVRQAISAFFGARRVNVLDLGAHLGYFSLMLSLEGHRLTAVEMNSRYYEQMNYLKEALDLQTMRSVRQDAVDFVESESRLGAKYDLIILLSLVYHLARKDRERTRNFLRTCFRLSGRLLVDDEPNTGVLTREILQELAGDMCWIEPVFRGSDQRTIYALKSTRKHELADGIEIERVDAPLSVYSREYFEPWDERDSEGRDGRRRDD